MIEVGDGRGKQMIELARKNKEAVLEYFSNNPESTLVDCQRALKMSYPIVRKYVDELGSK